MTVFYLIWTERSGVLQKPSVKHGDWYYRSMKISKKEVTEEELYSCMGLPMYDIAAKLFPSLSEDVRNQLMDELCEFENGYLEKRGGVLFNGLEETLAQLQKI